MASSTPSAKRIVLVGMMGAGKSTVGSLLADRLALPFCDSDAEVETWAGGSIAEIFERHGEATFRRWEADAIDDVLDEPVVLAAGGGAVTDGRSRRLIDDADLVVWLRARPETLSRRVGHGSGRPLLAGDVETSLSRLCAERAPLYAAVADLVVDVDDLSVEETVDRIAAELDT